VDSPVLTSTRHAMPTSSFLDFITEQLAPIGPIKTARFFGGIGLKSASVQFGMMMEGRLYFVVNDATRPAYEAAGSQCFSYTTKKGTVLVRRYFEVPPDIMEEAPRLQELARESIQAAGHG
jgi:DNA transformation protein and related proteins